MPDPEGTTGARFDPMDVEEIAAKLAWIAKMPGDALEAMGRRAAEIVALWGPDRFAQGVVEAIELARESARRHFERGLSTVPTA